MSDSGIGRKAEPRRVSPRIQRELVLGREHSFNFPYAFQPPSRIVPARELLYLFASVDEGSASASTARFKARSVSASFSVLPSLQKPVCQGLDPIGARGTFPGPAGLLCRQQPMEQGVSQEPLGAAPEHAHQQGTESKGLHPFQLSESCLEAQWHRMHSDIESTVTQKVQWHRERSAWPTGTKRGEK